MNKSPTNSEMRVVGIEMYCEPQRCNGKEVIKGQLTNDYKLTARYSSFGAACPPNTADLIPFTGEKRNELGISIF